MSGFATVNAYCRDHLNDEDVCRDVAFFLHRLAPSIGVPTLLTDRCHLPTRISYADAFTMHGAWWYLSSCLAEPTRPQHVIVLCGGVTEGYLDIDPALATAKAIHEWGHSLLCRPDRAPTRPAPSRDRLAELIESLERTRLQPSSAEASSTSPPWLHHDAAFIRCTIALHHQAVQMGHALRLERTLRTEPYQLSDVRLYQAALGRQARWSLRIVDLLAESYPDLFATLWQHDTGEPCPDPVRVEIAPPAPSQAAGDDGYEAPEWARRAVDKLLAARCRADAEHVEWQRQLVRDLDRGGAVVPPPRPFHFPLTPFC